VDHNLTRQQIGAMNLMSCGARDFVGDSDSLMFRVGSKRGIVAKIIVKLASDDTYTVRYVEMRKGSCEILIDELEEMVYEDSLGATVRKMGDR
jgi:hypothetical protein